MKDFTIVVAVDSELGIGKTGTLPWRLKEDMKHFRELTTGPGNVVIMGRKTWESIPEKFRPLPNRINVVLSRTRETTAHHGATTFSTLDAVLRSLDAVDTLVPQASGKVFVIGGGEIYREAIVHPGCTEIWITRVGASFDCDVTFPRYEDRFKLDSVTGRFTENGIECTIERWLRR